MAEATKAQTEAEAGQAEVEAGQAEAGTGQTEAEVGPSMPSETKAVTSEVQADQQTSDTILTVGQDMAERAKSPASEASAEAADYIYRHASGKKLSKDEIVEARHYAQKLKYPKGALVFNDSNKDDFQYCLSDNKKIFVCREIAKSMGFPKLEEGLSIMSKDDLADSLAYNSIKGIEVNFDFENEVFYLSCSILSSSLKGLILSNALRAQKNIEDEGYTMALNNLRSEVIELRNEGLEKDKILISLVNKVKEDEAHYKAQTEAQKIEIEDLQRQLAEAKENCTLAQANKEISEYWKNYLEKNVEELHESKERCFEKSLDCVKKLKTSFAKVGAYSTEENFIRGDPEGVVEWISGEAEAFEEILSDRGDVCVFFGA
jgi:hypothetical protein